MLIHKPGSIFYDFMCVYYVYSCKPEFHIFYFTYSLLNIAPYTEYGLGLPFVHTGLEAFIGHAKKVYHSKKLKLSQV